MIYYLTAYSKDTWTDEVMQKKFMEQYKRGACHMAIRYYYRGMNDAELERLCAKYPDNFNKQLLPIKLC